VQTSRPSSILLKVIGGSKGNRVVPPSHQFKGYSNGLDSSLDYFDTVAISAGASVELVLLKVLVLF
jgi:hypothetical protein